MWPKKIYMQGSVANRYAIYMKVLYDFQLKEYLLKKGYFSYSGQKIFLGAFQLTKYIGSPSLAWVFNKFLNMNLQNIQMTTVYCFHNTIMQPLQNNTFSTAVLRRTELMNLCS